MFGKAGRKQHNITGVAPNEPKLARVDKVVRADHRQGCGVGGWSSGVVRDNKVIRSELCECKQKHALYKYPPGKLLDAKCL